MPSPVELLQTLIRFNTTNPPGNETEAITYLDRLLTGAGIATTILTRTASRPNLIARIPGSGQAPPFLMQGHIDVVPTTGQQWDQEPFGGRIIDGYVWGRGALDMKGGVAMMVDAFMRMAASERPPAGDIILCILSDEENGGNEGARFLVEEHAHHFKGVEYCIGEFGGFPLELGGRRFYPIQVAERVGVLIDLTFRGAAGHGSLPTAGGAMAKLGTALTRLDRKRMPVHLTPATRLMLEGMIEHTDGAIQRVLRLLLDERTAGPAFKLLSSRLSVLEPVFRNTVNATVVRGGDKDNVVPAEVSVRLDGRMLPGFDPDEMIEELRSVIGKDVEITYKTEGLPPVGEPNLALFDLLARILKDRDPLAIPVPFLLPAVTDGRWFGRLGIQHYGFLPMQLPAGFEFQSTVHAANERIPTAAVNNGSDAIFDLLERYPGEHGN
ncbi:MAG: M20/M25/M40 family metallo-hydrolase [Acidimicrobiia bacterium]|nr:M20/M25/M40 family metallo-hydrolase [Acidimicrobiia bacterium]